MIRSFEVLLVSLSVRWSNEEAFESSEASFDALWWMVEVSLYEERASVLVTVDRNDDGRERRW